MAAVFYDFEWDPAKAQTNFTKHGVAFEKAAEVFLDPLAITIPDAPHSELETRWITLGRDGTGRYILVVHTFRATPSGPNHIRLISARRPTSTEIRDYEEGL